MGKSKWERKPPSQNSGLSWWSNSTVLHFLSALRELKSDVWGNDLSHPSGCSLQLEALVHVHYMVTGRWTFHPSSVTGRQLRERKEKTSCETAFLEWIFARVAMEMGTSCTSSVRACKRTSRYLRWSFVSLLDTEGTPPSPPPLCLLTTVQFPAGISLQQLFLSISFRLWFPDVAGLSGKRVGRRLRHSDYHMNLCLFFERHWRWGFKQKPFQMDLHH